MKRFLALGAALLAMSLPGHAGTVTNPEVTDPSGDATWPGLHGLNADWADITGVWFESLRSSHGDLNGFRVHVGTLFHAAAPDRDARFTVSWSVPAGSETFCYAILDIDRNDVGDVWEQGRPGALLNYGCDADGESVDAGGIRPINQSRG